MTKERLFHTVLRYLACEHVILLDLAHLGNPKAELIKKRIDPDPTFC